METNSPPQAAAIRQCDHTHQFEHALRRCALVAGHGIASASILLDGVVVEGHLYQRGSEDLSDMIRTQLRVDEIAGLRQAHADVAADNRVFRELADAALGIISSVSNGGWSTQSEEWREAAMSWRDRYVAAPNSPPPDDAARPHIVRGEFQSDKYPSTPRGKVPLSVEDRTAQDLLWIYAQRRREVDPQFADDLEFALRRAGYEPTGFESLTVRGELKDGRLTIDQTIPTPTPPPAPQWTRPVRTTHTYALMEVSGGTHAEVLTKLRAAGYDHAIHCDANEHDGQARLDMHGIALITTR